MTQTEFILVRHGETLWNLEGRLQGQQDSPLTERGMAQAKAVATRLADERIAAIYASNLNRVLIMAQQIADRTGAAIIQDPRLRERSNGCFEGLTRDEAEQQYPDLFQQYGANRSPDFAIPGAESARQLLERGLAFFTELAASRAGERVVVVSHGGLLSSVLRHIIGVPLGEKHGFRLENGSISLVNHSAAQWQVVTLGEIFHLHWLEK